jgi:hypothetical protein
VVGGGIAGGVVADGDGLPVPVFSAEPQAANSEAAPKMSAHSIGVQKCASDFMQPTLSRGLSYAKRQLQTITSSRHKVDGLHAPCADFSGDRSFILGKELK